MKQQLDDINALPSKRIYQSIIADYHIKLAICELIDNSIDNWIYNGKLFNLNVFVELDYQRQVIKVIDNSGGIKEDNIPLIVSPGHSRNTAEDQTIGIFGVGSKRAVVALAEDVKIFTRYKKADTYLVEINDDWIKDDSNWNLPFYKVDKIAENTTIIELTKLRNPISKDYEFEFIKELGATYALYLEDSRISININNTKVQPVTFDIWSYPPDFEPKSFLGEIDFGTSGKISLEILGGLTKAGEPSKGEYGAYFYCNNRLISKAYKGEEIGYRQFKIGSPHPSVSLARIIVKVSGSALLMPWNSSKSEINIKHNTFKQIREHIEKILMHYSNLSKKWSGFWEEQVFAYTEGSIKSEVVQSITAETKLFLPPIPRTTLKKYPSLIKSNNRKLAQQKPWVTGLYETIIAVDEITKLRLDQKNRIAFLALDSMLEIAFKEYLANESPTAYNAQRLENIMRNRGDVQREVMQTMPMSAAYWKKIEYFYKLRCELVHKRVTVTISDKDLQAYRVSVEYTLTKLFGLNFKSRD